MVTLKILMVFFVLPTLEDVVATILRVHNNPNE
jgi:hypothetical protein